MRAAASSHAWPRRDQPGVLADHRPRRRRPDGETPVGVLADADETGDALEIDDEPAAKPPRTELDQKIGAATERAS